MAKYTVGRALKLGLCTYRVAKVGICSRPVPAPESRCIQHASEHKAKCWGCGEKAVRDCEFAVEWVCATPLCESCVHVHWGIHGPLGRAG